METVSRVYIDANILIHLFEHKDDLSKALAELFTAQTSGVPFLATSELTLTEVLVEPYKSNDDQLIDRYDAWTISNDQLEVGAVVRPVLWHAAVLRSNYPALKTPDAIHLSTAIGMRCTHFLTADKRLTGQYELRHRRYGMVRGPSRIAILRPEMEVIRLLTKAAAE